MPPTYSTTRGRMARRPELGTTIPPALQEGEQGEDDRTADQEDGRDRGGLAGGGDRVVGVLELAVDQGGRDLGAERQVARDEDERPVLAERPRERQGGAGQDGRQDR